MDRDLTKYGPLMEVHVVDWKTVAEFVQDFIGGKQFHAKGFPN